METKTTPIEHIRGTTFKIHGHIFKRGVLKTDVALDVLSFTISQVGSGGVLTPVLIRTTPNPSVFTVSGSQVTILLPPVDTQYNTLPDGYDYWYQVDDTDNVTGQRWCVGRGPLKLYHGANA